MASVIRLDGKPSFPNYFSYYLETVLISDWRVYETMGALHQELKEDKKNV